ncbi:hypothetical protein B0H10DRAFT_1939829 [Mycena sp. CBHHK59/15]|nr:hypothetical protein B0H10DRAFT_1939829 [Mycena sp. CBHHK59/15]
MPIMPADPSEDKKDYRLCPCSSQDCKGQLWEGKDRKIQNGKWCHRSTQAKHYAKDTELRKQKVLNPEIFFLAAQRIVAFIPNSPSFLSGHANDGLTIKALTDKYGPEVFKNYHLDYRTGGEDSGGDGEKSGANSDDSQDDSGETVGSRDSNDEESDADGESAGSFISDDEGAMDRDGDAYGSKD